MDNSELFSFGFDYGRRVIPIQPLTYWKLVPEESTKAKEKKEKKEEQKLELNAKICCRSCIEKVKEALYDKFPGITDIQVEPEKSKIVVVGKVEDRSAVLKRVKKILRGAKFATETEKFKSTPEKSKSTDSGEASSKSKSTASSTTKDHLVQYYVPTPPFYQVPVPPNPYYYHPDQMWPYPYPPPPPYYYHPDQMWPYPYPPPPPYYY